MTMGEMWVIAVAAMRYLERTADGSSAGDPVAHRTDQEIQQLCGRTAREMERTARKFGLFLTEQKERREPLVVALAPNLSMDLEEQS